MSQGKRRVERSLWALALLVSLANLPLHKPLSDFFDALYAQLGRAFYERVVVLAISAMCIAAVMAFLWRRGHGPWQPRLLASLLALGALTLASQRWLVVSNIELVHLPQFGLIAALLLASGLSPLKACLVATAAGVLDEAYQHWVIYADTPGTYFDYNDIVLNGVGAAWAALVFALGRRPNDAKSEPADWDPLPLDRSRRWVVFGVLAAFALLIWLDPPQFAHMLERAATGRMYRVLSAPEALGALVLLSFLISFGHSEKQRTAAG